MNIKVNLTVSPHEFDKLYEGNMLKFKTYRQAYEATELQVVAATGRRHYTDNESYRVARNKRIKRNKVTHK